MKRQILVVVDRNGEEHRYDDDDAAEYRYEYSEGKLSVSVNSGFEHAPNDGVPWPAVTVAEFFEPRLLRIFWA